MRIRVISDLHLDVNERFPFSLRGVEKDEFALVAGDISGNVKLTSRWVRENLHNGMFVVGNHDPSYNELPMTIQKQKEFLAKRHGLDSNVTFLDESVGVMSKEIPGTNIMVVGSALYTDYKYMSEYDQNLLEKTNQYRKEHPEGDSELLTPEKVNMSRGHRGLNDFRWGKVEDEQKPRKQRFLTPNDYKTWFDKTFSRISEIVEANKDKEIIVLTHHCPTPKCIDKQYVDSTMNASYVSDLESFILEHPNIKAWCCGHVHSVHIDKVGDTLIVCNPRGYEKNMESVNWNPNTFIDTEKWEIVTEEYSNAKLEQAREKWHDDFKSISAFFI